MVANTLWVLSLCLAPLAMAAPQSKVYWDYWDYYYYCYYVTAPGWLTGPHASLVRQAETRMTSSAWCRRSSRRWKSTTSRSVSG